MGQPITRVEVLPPGGAIAVRDLAQQGLDEVWLGGQFTTIRRRGKFLVFTVESAADRFLVINPKLTGRLQLAAVGDRCYAKTDLVLTLAGGQELRYTRASVATSSILP